MWWVKVLGWERSGSVGEHLSSTQDVLTSITSNVTLIYYIIYITIIIIYITIIIIIIRKPKLSMLWFFHNKIQYEFKLQQFYFLASFTNFLSNYFILIFSYYFLFPCHCCTIYTSTVFFIWRSNSAEKLAHNFNNDTMANFSPSFIAF